MSLAKRLGGAQWPGGDKQLGVVCGWEWSDGWAWPCGWAWSGSVSAELEEAPVLDLPGVCR